jgi:DNA replication protein DnaC
MLFGTGRLWTKQLRGVSVENKPETAPPQYTARQENMTLRQFADSQMTENCSLCRGTGYRLENGKSFPCDCSRERRIVSRLPVRYRTASLNDFSSQIQEAVHFALARKTDGLLITGPVGTGKTHLAAAIVRHLVRLGNDAIFRRCAKFYSDLRNAYQENASEESILVPIASAAFVVMDDLGAGSLSDHERRSTLELLDRRLNENLPTIVTTNWTLSKISECMDDRIASRLAGFSAIELTGTDLRIHGGNKKGNF